MKISFITIFLLFSICLLSAQTNVSVAEQYNKRGIYLMEIENYSDAIMVFTEAIKNDPNLADAYYNRASAILKSNTTIEGLSICGDIEKAIALGSVKAKNNRKKFPCN